jgi:cation:H+ antiporter
MPAGNSMLDFSAWPLWANLAAFIGGAVVVWISGSHLVRLVDRLATRTGIGRAFAGMLLLGGMVSLTEIATVSTAAFTGSPTLSLNNLLGSASINIFLLAAADPVSGREALTSFIAKPAMLFQGTLCILLLVLVAIAITAGDYAFMGIGVWSALIFLLCLLALWRSFRYEKRDVWRVADETTAKDERKGERKAPEPGTPAGGSAPQGSLRALILKVVGAGIIIFGAGFVLSLAGDAIADQTGLGESFVGLLLVGISTSLPELSTILAAVRIKRYEMAVGDILGSNLFNVLLIFLAEVVYRGGPVLNHGGRFEIVASLLGASMTAMLLLGLLERRQRTILRMGYDSATIIAMFLGGLVLLYFLSGT